VLFLNVCKLLSGSVPDELGTTLFEQAEKVQLVLVEGEAIAGWLKLTLPGGLICGSHDVSAKFYVPRAIVFYSPGRSHDVAGLLPPRWDEN
jgi:hypothetical protein